MKTNEKAVKETYRLAKKAYETWDIDTETVMSTLDGLPISLHCWQSDDVGGFETPDGLLTGGIMATCAYPGKARSGDELRSDIDQALALIPGSHRLNLHAIYAETGDKVVDRTESCVIGSHEFYMGYAATVTLYFVLTQAIFTLQRSSPTKSPLLSCSLKACSSMLAARYAGTVIISSSLMMN